MKKLIPLLAIPLLAACSTGGNNANQITTTASTARICISKEMRVDDQLCKDEKAVWAYIDFWKNAEGTDPQMIPAVDQPYESESISFKAPDQFAQDLPPNALMPTLKSNGQTTLDIK